MLGIKDPLNNEIILTKKCWHGHIIKEHPVMKHFLGKVKETIGSPDYIFKSKISQKSNLYFKQFINKQYGRFYIMVVVDMKSDINRGYIKTSFPVYNLSKGGKLIWERT